jgi:hypothetical protein
MSENKQKKSNLLKLPFEMIQRDKLIVAWIILTISTAFFPTLIDLLHGNKIKENFDQGVLYIFSITLLLPITTEIIITFISESRKKELMERLKMIEEKKLLPIINKYSVEYILHCIYGFNFIIIIFSIPLYSGLLKGNVIVQLIISVFAFYISLFYFCLNMLSHYPEQYNEYNDDEINNIKELKTKVKEADSFMADDGSEVKL